MTIDVVEVTPARDDLVAVAVEVHRRTDPELNPGDPPVSADELRGELFSRTTQKHVRTWVALVDGAPAGTLAFELEDNEENRHLAASDWFAVVPVMRRRGVADALLRTALDAVAAAGRTSLLLWAHRNEPDVGGAYARRLGLSEKSEERCSRMRIDTHDSALVERWMREGRSRTDGYRLVPFGDRCPEEHLPPYLEASRAMEDMPTDALEWTVAPTDATLARSREAMWAERRLVVARSLVLAPDGSGAGMTELFVNGYRPQLAYQGDTGVVAAHRGHGLGRWLKAENLRHAQQLAPGFEVVETYNAQSNPWMLDINVAMGFRPHLLWRGFQGDLGAARAVVG